MRRRKLQLSLPAPVASETSRSLRTSTFHARANSSPCTLGKHSSMPPVSCSATYDSPGRAGRRARYGLVHSHSRPVARFTRLVTLPPRPGATAHASAPFASVSSARGRSPSGGSGLELEEPDRSAAAARGLGILGERDLAETLDRGLVLDTGECHA